MVWRGGSPSPSPSPPPFWRLLWERGEGVGGGVLVSSTLSVLAATVGGIETRPLDRKEADVAGWLRSLIDKKGKLYPEFQPLEDVKSLYRGWTLDKANHWMWERGCERSKVTKNQAKTLGFSNVIFFFWRIVSIIYLPRILCLCVCDSQLRNALLFF